MDEIEISLYRTRNCFVDHPNPIECVENSVMFTLLNNALFVVCGLLTLMVCMRARAFGSRFNLMDIPDERKKHLAATPLIGGVALAIAFIPVAFALILLTSSERWLPTLLVWLGCIAAMVFVGLADDRHSLSPRARLLISFIIFAIAAAIDPTFNIRLLDFEYPRWTLGLGTWWLAIIFTVVCSVGLTNAVNMADGKNGLVIGLCLGWLGLLAMRAPVALLPVMLLLGVALAVLLLFNLRGQLFLGDGGAYGLACSLGLLAIMIYNSSGEHALRAISADELVFLFAIPVFDSFRLTYVRIKQGRSPMNADRDHLHHHLQDKFGWPNGLLVYITLALLPSGIILAAG
jgi:UDP-GlcNAc:undecaprenyl-phosphate/decaprenyl-phosphate GlcNAc-1-phosphate transferase